MEKKRIGRKIKNYVMITLASLIYAAGSACFWIPIIWRRAELQESPY